MCQPQQGFRSAGFGHITIASYLPPTLASDLDLSIANSSLTTITIHSLNLYTRRGHAPPSIEEYQVGWVCALPKELTAARAMLDKEHE